MASDVNRSKDSTNDKPADRAATRPTGEAAHLTRPRARVQTESDFKPLTPEQIAEIEARTGKKIDI